MTRMEVICRGIRNSNTMTWISGVRKRVTVRTNYSLVRVPSSRQYYSSYTPVSSSSLWINGVSGKHQNHGQRRWKMLGTTGLAVLTAILLSTKLGTDIIDECEDRGKISRNENLLYTSLSVISQISRTLKTAVAEGWMCAVRPSLLLESEQQSSPSSPVQTLPSRKEMLQRLAQDQFDLLIIGGGATGAGIAVDAQSRGLSVAVVERSDFSAGTSSKSTKLVHGGVRYLEKAFLELDKEQYDLVVEALRERGILLRIAPHLAYEIPIMLPIPQAWKIPYYWVGAKFYDVFAGSEALSSSFFLSRDQAISRFPLLQPDKLAGAIVYYDGAQNDSRVNVALITSAIEHGATIANYVEVVELLKRPRTTNLGLFELGKDEIVGARVRNVLTGETWCVKAKGVINATGPFTDGIRSLDVPTVKPIVSPSAGAHIVLPSYFCPSGLGFIDPHTSDGRVIFFLPWQGNVIAGTTDTPSSITQDPLATEDEVDWILREMHHYMLPGVQLSREHVLAAWSGIRPLVRNPKAKNTESLVRNHMINTSESGLITIAGGKWTTYRAMAEETVDEAIKIFGLSPNGECITQSLLLTGAKGWSKTLYVDLIQQFSIPRDIAEHLAENYGDRAPLLLSHFSAERLHPAYPFVVGEIAFAVKHELACTAVDVLARRMRLAFLDVRAAFLVLPRVIEVMSKQQPDGVTWSRARRRQEMADALVFLQSMGLNVMTEGRKE